MSNVSANSLSGFLAVYAQQSLEQFIAQAPILNQLTTNFDPAVANGGISVTTRIPTTSWGAPNDLTKGWGNTQATSSAVTVTLKMRDYDMVFNELEFSTLTPTMLQNLYFPSMIGQLANGVVVDALNNVTSSVYTTTMSVSTSSNLAVTGALSSLQYASQLLTQNEVPAQQRFCYLSPAAYSGVVAGVIPTYIYGSPDAVKNYSGLKLIDFDPVFQYPRFYGASLPQGGVAYNDGDKLIGIAGHKTGLVAAMRAPVDINNGLVQTATAVDKSSGISLQVRYMYDGSLPGYRLAVVTIFGTNVGNTKGIIPIITQST